MVIAPIWLALALVAPAEAQPVTVEVVSVGHVDTPADRFELVVMVTAGADTEALAKDLLGKREQTVLDQTKAAGAEASILTGNEFDLITTNPAAMMSLMRADSALGGKADGKQQANGIISVRASTRAAIDRAKAAIEKITGARVSGKATASLVDEKPARNAAKADALSKARSEADAYVGRLGYGSATLVAISEKGDIGTMFDAMSGGKATMFPFQRSIGNTVSTSVTLTVTFRLDPKR